MIGRTLSHYRILRPLGAGGMGVVYLAHDDHLDRDVALKILPPGSIADQSARRRFRNEAQALSRLNHSHIATIFDFDTQEGLDFLVMELIEGEPLSVRIARGALPEAEVRELGSQIAQALEAAHRRHVVHRDLKPPNIMVTPEGQVKVLDFGLAQLVRESSGSDLSRSLTETGVILGTVPYMAPEQLLGQPVDARADLYSLGVVLYEMATGRSPYRETVPTALIYEIVHRPVTPPREVAPGVSAQIEAVVLRCLEKAPEARYPSARAVGANLDEPARSVAAPTTRPAASSARRRTVRVAVMVLSLLAAVAAGLLVLDPGRIRERLTGGGGEADIRSLAVLPLDNLSRDPEQEYFVDGMTDELITRLSQVAALRVISRSSAMLYKGTTKRLPQIAHELHVDAVVEGAVMRSGGRARITAQLIRTATDQTLWGDSFEGDLKDVFSLQSQVARAIVEKVRVNLTARERARIASARPVDPAVNEAVLKGRYFVNRSSGPDWKKGLDYFNQAIHLDPGYAPSFAGLAEAYTMLSNIVLPPREAMPRAKAAALKALEIDPATAEAREALGYVKAFYEWDWRAGGDELQRALELAPGDAVAHRNYGSYLLSQARYDEAKEQFKRALEIDPLSTWLLTTSMWPLFEGRRYDEAIATGDRILREDSTLAFVRMVRGQALLKKGETARAIADLRIAAGQETSTGPRAWLAYAFGSTGHRDSALAIRDDLRAHALQTYVAPYSWAILYTGVGKKDSAFFWLDQAIAERSEDLIFVRSDPSLDPLRSDPRFGDMLRRMGFSPQDAR